MPNLPFQFLQVLGLALFLTLGTLVILIVPPMLFSHVEGWSFGQGFYFAFITLSTIGFGDYVVGKDKKIRHSLEPGVHCMKVPDEVGYFWGHCGLLVASSEILFFPQLVGESTPMESEGGCAPRHKPSPSLTGTDPSKHYITMYRSLAAVWIVLSLAWLAVVLSLGSLLLHRCSILWLLIRGLDPKDGGAPDPDPSPQKISIST